MATQRDKRAKVTKRSIGTTPGRILRIVLLVAGFVLLGTIFLMIVVPRERGTVPPPATEITPEEEATEEIGEGGGREAAETDEGYAEDEDDGGTAELEVEDVDEVGEETGESETVDYSGVYVGNGEDETIDTKTVWEITMELSGERFVSVEGKVNYIEDTVEGTGKWMEFSVLESIVELKLSETDKEDIFISGKYDRNKVNIFSINDRRQFFLYITPKKVNIDAALLPGKPSAAKANTPLIDMSGFLKEDGVVVGMLRSPFVPMVEYSLELVGD